MPTTLPDSAALNADGRKRKHEQLPPLTEKAVDRALEFAGKVTAHHEPDDIIKAFDRLDAALPSPADMLPASNLARVKYGRVNKQIENLASENRRLRDENAKLWKGIVAARDALEVRS